MRGCRGDPQRNDFQRRIQPEGIRFQAAALKGAAKLFGCPGVADRDLEGVFLAPVAKLGVPGHCRSLRVGAQVGQGGALRGREPLGQVGSGDRPHHGVDGLAARLACEHPEGREVAGPGRDDRPRDA